MAKTRISKRVVNAVSDEEFLSALATVAQNDAQQQKINAQMDERITAIRKKYAPELERLQEGISEATEVVETYCDENPQLFTTRKSYETPHGTVGYRTGTHKLKLIKGFKLAQVLDNIKAYLPGYIRTTEEIAKDRLIADRNTEEVIEHLPKCGYKVEQDERFFIELKKEAELV